MADPDSPPDPTARAADAAMAEFCRNGDPAALGRLFDLAAPALRKVAGHVAGDAHTADDLVQAAFLVAIERADGFRPGAPVLPWLTGILRNQALLVHRRRRRALDPSRLAPEPARDPAADAERAELSARIEAAIGELSEAYRPVLVLALQHGLGAHEIAAALGRPEGSVRTQLMRGLEKLRALLPVSLAGAMAGLLPSAGHAAMRAAVLAAAARKGTVLAATFAPSLLLSGIAMKKLFAVAAVALLASALWLALPDSDAKSTGAAEPAPAPLAAAGDVAPAGARQDAPRREVAADSTLGELRGRLVHAATRAPLAGVRIEAREARRKLAAVTVDGGPAVVTTDADGRFALRFKAKVQLDRFLIARTPHNVGTDLRRSVRVEPGASVDVELEASPGVRVSGMVVDAAGAPVPRARVFAWDGREDGVARTTSGFDRQPDVQGQADAQGRFDLTAVADEFVLSADQDTLWCPERLAGQRHARAHIDGVELRLAPTVELLGQLLDHDGTPVPNHDVRTARGGSQRASKVPELVLVRAEYVDARTDAHGRFRARAIAELAYQFDVDHPQRPSLHASHRPADGELILRLQRGAELIGQMFLADGSPAVGAEVSWPAAITRKDVCDAAGRFRLVGLEFATGSTLRVSHPAAAIFVQHLATAPAGELRIQLEPAQAIRGRVLDAQGQPLAGAAVRVVGDRVLKLGYSAGEPTTWEYVVGMNRVESAADGGFAFARLYPGEFAVRVNDPNAADAYAEVSVRSGADGVVLRLPDLLRERVTLRGRVSAPRGTLPTRLRLVLWRVSDRDGTSIHETSTSHDLELQDGRFELRGVQPGALRLDLDCVGFARWGQPRREFAAGVHEVAVELLPLRHLIVEVRDREGAPVQGMVSASTPDGVRLWLTFGGVRTTGVNLDLEGRARLNGLPERAVVLSVNVTGRDDATEHAVDLPTVRDEVVRIEVAPAPKIQTLLPVVLVAAPGTELAPLLAARELDELARQVFGKSVTRPLDVDCELRLVNAAGKVVSRSKVETRADDPNQPAYRVASVWASGGSQQHDFIPMGWPNVDLRAYPGALHLEVEAKGYEPVRLTVTAADFMPEPRGGEPPSVNPRVVPVILRKAK